MQDRYAYYPGCLASLSAKELDTSTRAVAAKLEIELVEMESTTCCGAGDIHEAKPDYYLHLNARILSQAEALGCDTLLTICNVCTLNLRQANKRLQERPEELERITRTIESKADLRISTWCIFDNTALGAATADALTVRSLLLDSERAIR